MNTKSIAVHMNNIGNAVRDSKARLDEFISTGGMPCEEVHVGKNISSAFNIDPEYTNGIKIKSYVIDNDNLVIFNLSSPDDINLDEYTFFATIVNGQKSSFIKLRYTHSNIKEVIMNRPNLNFENLKCAYYGKSDIIADGSPISLSYDGKYNRYLTDAATSFNGVGDIRINKDDVSDVKFNFTYDCNSDHFTVRIPDNINVDDYVLTPRLSGNNIVCFDLVDKLSLPRKTENWDNYFMKFAILASSKSKDPSTQVGACIVKDNKIIGIGYNGFPAGVDESELCWARTGSETKYPYVVHAEMNAILNANSQIPKESVLYVTLFPCEECAKFIAQTGIKEIYYLEDKYKGTEGRKQSERMLDLAHIYHRQVTNDGLLEFKEMLLK